MDIITLRNNVQGKTANGKTLCAFLVLRFYLQKSPHLGRRGSRSNKGTRKKSKKSLNETKDIIKHLPGEQLAAVKIESNRKKMKWRLKSADMTDG